MVDLGAENDLIRKTGPIIPLFFEVTAMSEACEHSLADLRREIETGGARPTVIDVAISELMAEGDPRLPGDLLQLLSDRAEYDEGMFSLIHAAESYDDSAYVRASFCVSSPHVVGATLVLDRSHEGVE